MKFTSSDVVAIRLEWVLSELRLMQTLQARGHQVEPAKINHLIDFVDRALNRMAEESVDLNDIIPEAEEIA